MAQPRRFPPAWTVEEPSNNEIPWPDSEENPRIVATAMHFPYSDGRDKFDACFIVKDSNEQALGYVYYEVRATYLSYAARKPQHLCAIGKSYVLAPPPHQGE